MKLTLRLLTVFSYFLPFVFFLVTCNNGSLKTSYNKKEAEKNIAAENEGTEYKKIDSIHSPDSTKAIMPVTDIPKDSLQNKENKSKKESRLELIQRKMILPTDQSLSGFGAFFYYKNLMGKIVICISMLISLFLLLVFAWLKSPKLKLYLLSANVLCVAIFIADSIFSKVSLLWGIWILLALLFLQIWIEANENKKERILL
jgi:hypothetical protein